MKRLDDYLGRVFTAQELTPTEQALAQQLPSTIKREGKLVCARCLGEMTHRLPSGAAYCRDCIRQGRVTDDQPLYHFPQEAFPAQTAMTWQGQLTTDQARVSAQLLTAQKNKEDILVHAVTGAGKTEMIYGVIDQALGQGQSVAVVSPRIDVCRELHVRLSRDFSCESVLLHGEGEPYRRVPLVVSTVHQLYRFYEAFDLIIIDEVDAFPFVDNASLYHAVSRALKTTGSRIFLTATSTDELDKQVKAGQLKQVHLARRFHAKPLVVPKQRYLPRLLDHLGQGKLPPKLLTYLKEQGQAGFPLLIFFPHIHMGQKFCQLLQAYLPEEKIGFVSSQSPDREQLVDDFRQGRLRILVSTTILERGVTFPKVDVIVLWSNHKLFNRSSLVQIAGRVGRSPERPTGDLLFFHEGMTFAMREAISEIKLMNMKGGFA